MKTNYSKHKRKLKSAEAIMQKLKEKYPDFDFDDAMRLFYEIKKYREAKAMMNMS